MAIFHGRSHTSLTDDDIGELINAALDNITDSLSKHTQRKRMVSGCCYESGICCSNLPADGSVHLQLYSIKFAATKAVVNVDNSRDRSYGSC